MSRVLFSVALAGSVLVTIDQPATASSPTGAKPAAKEASAGSGPASGLVTLVTGDRILVQNGSYVVQDNPARRDVTFLGYQHNGHLNVIPSDAIGLLGTQLDSRLFDVTALMEAGYGDGRDLGLIVKYAKNAKAAARASVSKGGGKVTAELESIGAVAVRADHAKTTNLWTELTTGNARGRQLKSGVTKIWLDGVVRPTLDFSLQQIGAPTAHAAGFDGTGVKVAVVDSGIDTTHPDLSGGKVVASANFTTEAPEDLLGHGTHVASILAGTGAGSGGQFKGVAPGAQLVSAKVCQLPNVCLFSAILDGMEWAVDQGVDVVNMSLGGPDTAEIDPIEEAINILTASHGVLFVVAAGNGFPPIAPFSVSSPSTADAALSVGAVDPGDGLAFFSNIGPRVGDTALKPDMTAPGLGITAARSSFSSLPGDLYTEQNGTSMAAPHVAGAAAILAQRRPTWTAAQLKAALMGSTFQPANNTPVFSQGAGRLDVARGYNQTVLASPPSVSLGRALGPHEDDPVLNRTITYTNTNTSSGVNLTLSLTTQAPGGGPAPAGMFALSTTSLSLPPGGTASVTLTATTSVSAPDGFYGGWVTATGNAGGVRVATPFAVHRTPPGKEITFNHRNRAGEFTHYTTLLIPLTAGKPVYVITSLVPFGPIGPRTEFIENGDYLFFTMVPEVASPTFDTSILVQPKLTVNASTPSTIDLNGATAQPVTITLPNPSAQTFSTVVAAVHPTNPNNVWVQGFSRGQIYTKELGPPNTFTSGFVTKVQRTSYVPAPGRTDPHNAPTVYNVAWFNQQQFVTGFTRNVTAGQLARRDVTYGRNIAGAFGVKSYLVQPQGTRLEPAMTTEIITFDLPHTQTEFYNTEGGIRWSGFLHERISPAPGQETVVNSLESAPTAFTAGTTVAESWNKPVYGPSLASVLRPEDWVVRKGNTIMFLPPMLGDSAGHAGYPVTFFTPLPGLTGQMVLKRNGVVVGSASLPHDLLPRPSATVPPEWSPYTLEATLSRGGPTELGTTISAVWSFNSSSVDPNSILVLPLWTVTFKPTLSATNGAPAGSFAIPLTAVAQPTSPVGGINTITVQYSTNDGATWQNATVTGSGANRTATVTNPGSGYVSLRATATDWAGNSVTQTTIRAYRIGG